MELSEKTIWNWSEDAKEYYFGKLFVISFSTFVIGAMSVIETIGNVRRRRLFFKN